LGCAWGAGVAGPAAVVTRPDGVDALELWARLAAVIGADGAIGGFSVYAEWRASDLPAPKDRDFGAALGPAVVTPDEGVSGAAVAGGGRGGGGRGGGRERLALGRG